MSAPAMSLPEELLPKLQERFAALGYPPDRNLYRVTVDDLLATLAEHLAKNPTELSDQDLEAILDQVTSYLNGEEMPWKLVITLGIEDGWPHPEETR